MLNSLTGLYKFFKYSRIPVSKEILKERLIKHIKTVVGHFKGKVIGWDVVNEAIEDDGSFRKSPYYNLLGEEFIEIAFRTAHEADPDAELYYNDYSMAKPGKREAVCRLIKNLKAVTDVKNITDSLALARYYKDAVFAAMKELRVVVDELEVNTASSYWPYPSYGELLFSVN